MNRWLKYGLILLAAIVVIIAISVGVVLGVTPGENSLKNMKAEISGPGLPEHFNAENIGFLDGLFYFASVIPNTSDVIVIQVLFKTGTTSYEIRRSISRILKDGIKVPRTTSKQLENVYQLATVETAKYYGDKYVLKNIRKN